MKKLHETKFFLYLEVSRTILFTPKNSLGFKVEDRISNNECEFMKRWQTLGLLAILVTGFLLISGCTTNAPAGQPLQTANQVTIPNLTGTWKVETQGGVIQKAGVPGQYTHHKGKYDTLTAQAVITDQKDRVMHGKLSASLGNDENFIGVIGMDNKSWYYADYDGTIEGQIVNNDQINIVYRHITENDTVIAVGTWTRVK